MVEVWTPPRTKKPPVPPSGGVLARGTNDGGVGSLPLRGSSSSRLSSDFDFRKVKKRFDGL